MSKESLCVSSVSMPQRARKPPSVTEVVTTPADYQALVPAEVGSTTIECSHRRKRHRVGRRSSDLVAAVPSVVFRRLVREIAHNFKSDLRWESEALEALQVDAEAYLISRFSEANERKELCKSGTLKRAHFVV